MGSASEDAYVTLLTSDGYLPGAMVLAHSLRDNGARKKLVAMVTTDSISADTVEELRSVYDTIIPVDRIRNRSPANLYLMNRPDLDSAFTKIQLWKLVQYRKIIYIDADVVTIRAPDELFNLPEPFSAAPDIGWPDLFNSGVMVLTPNMGDYYALHALADRGISFDGADQGLLNMHFTNYNRISFAYNCTPSGHYQYVPAYRHFQSTISMIHYIGDNKPWRAGREFGGPSGAYQELLGRWWATYDRHYKFSSAAVISGHASIKPRIVQRYVAGEQLLPSDYPSTPVPPTLTIRIDEPRQELHGKEPPRTTAEESMNEFHANANHARESQAISASPVQERRFSAPQAEWNPAVQPPPEDARPEAANFPRHTYSMSAEKDLFQPPTSYPEPPRDMWYQVPQRQPPSKPKPLFPWEENQAPPTRVFPVESVAPPPPELAPKHRPPPIQIRPDTSELDEFSVSPPPELEPDMAQAPLTPSRIFEDSPAPFSPSQIPFAEYKGSNAWDDMPAINRYVNAFQSRRKGGPQNLSLSSFSDPQILSPTVSKTEETRHRNLRITEFPTAVERPSLPVTPAPIRRNMLWGSERDAQGRLPEAEGVPGQGEWNPEQQLEELRRNSLLFAEDSSKTSTEAQLRNLPASSQEIMTSPQIEKRDELTLEGASQQPERERSESGVRDEKSENTPSSHSFGTDGAGSSTTVWVDHSTAGQTFERLSTQHSMHYTTTKIFESLQESNNSNTIERSTSQILEFDPRPTQASSGEAVRMKDI